MMFKFRRCARSGHSCERPLCAKRGHSFSGHSLKDFEAILDAHYLGRDVQLAEGRQSAISINTGW
jgi:hypothetical protein